MKTLKKIRRLCFIAMLINLLIGISLAIYTINTVSDCHLITLGIIVINIICSLYIMHVVENYGNRKRHN